MNLVKNPLVVIDTNVWISGAFWIGIPHDIIERVKSQDIIPVFSHDTFDELVGTLQRIGMMLRRADKAESALKKAKKFAIFFEPRMHVSLSRDVHDNMFLDIAIVSHAAFLITGDEDLLALKTIESTKIITPKQFIRLIGK